MMHRRKPRLFATGFDWVEVVDLDGGRSLCSVDTYNLPRLVLVEQRPCCELCYFDVESWY